MTFMTFMENMLDNRNSFINCRNKDNILIVVNGDIEVIRTHDK